MPFLHLRLAGLPLTPPKRQEVQRRLTDLTEQLLSKRHDLTAVLVEEVALTGWAVGGAPVPVAAHLEVVVTEGTNTAAQKAGFLAAVAALLRELAGKGLPLASYELIREIPAESWGYDGQTQAARRTTAQSI